VTPLRQLDRMPSAAAFLFQPATAVRFRPAGFTGSPMPKDEAAAPNPPAGAYLDYALKTAAKQVALEIRDERGGLVRRYTSADPAPKPDLAKLAIAPDWVPPPMILGTTPGMHRFVWPLRYAAPAALSEGRRGALGDGVWAPPGRYTAVLSVDGARLTQPLTVVPDPRVKTPPEGYAEQFALARRIEEARARVAAASSEVSAVEKALAERKKGAKPEVVPAIDALAKRLADLVGGSPELWWVPPPLGSLRALSAELDKLANAVDGTDDAPSPDAVAGFEKLQPAMAQALAAWEAVKAKELVILNGRLKRAGQPAIVP
jgi:hypothetical protein